MNVNSLAAPAVRRAHAAAVTATSLTAGRLTDLRLASHSDNSSARVVSM